MSDRKGRGEALTGVLVGKVWSCEIIRFRVTTIRFNFSAYVELL